MARLVKAACLRFDDLSLVSQVRRHLMTTGARKATREISRAMPRRTRWRTSVSRVYAGRRHLRAIGGTATREISRILPRRTRWRRLQTLTIQMNAQLCKRKIQMNAQLCKRKIQMNAQSCRRKVQMMRVSRV